MVRWGEGGLWVLLGKLGKLGARTGALFAHKKHPHRPPAAAQGDAERLRCLVTEESREAIPGRLVRRSGKSTSVQAYKSGHFRYPGPPKWWVLTRGRPSGAPPQNGGSA